MTTLLTFRSAKLVKYFSYVYDPGTTLFTLTASSYREALLVTQVVRRAAISIVLTRLPLLTTEQILVLVLNCYSFRVTDWITG